MNDTTVVDPTQLAGIEGRLTVTVINPKGDITRAVRCRGGGQALEVVTREAHRSPVWTLMLVTRQHRGKVQPVARWAVGPKGLVRTPYRRNDSERMDQLMNAARNAYSYGEMTTAEVRDYLADKYHATKQEAYLAAAAGRLLLEEPEAS